VIFKTARVARISSSDKSKIEPKFWMFAHLEVGQKRLRVLEADFWSVRFEVIQLPSGSLFDDIPV
jgi:hypothetical protein